MGVCSCVLHYSQFTATVIISSPADVLKFDNSYSWWHCKQIFYSVKLLPPEQSKTTPTEPEATPT